MAYIKDNSMNIFSRMSDWINKTKFGIHEYTYKPLEGWDEENNKNKKRHPIWYFIDDNILFYLEIYLIDRPHSFYYFVKRYFFDRYDIIKSKSIKRGQYCDITYRLPDAMFTLLESYYEKEFNDVVWYKEDSSCQGSDEYYKEIASHARKIKRAYWYKKNFWDKQDEIENKYLDNPDDFKGYRRYCAWKSKNDKRILGYIVDVHEVLWS